jgi:hypothetical protein
MNNNSILDSIAAGGMVVTIIAILSAIFWVLVFPFLAIFATSDIRATRRDTAVIKAAARIQIELLQSLLAAQAPPSGPAAPPQYGLPPTAPRP